MVVGEKIHCSLRFYYQNPSLSLENVGEPASTGITVCERKGPTAGTEFINKIPYTFIEWEWDAYPDQTGKILMPAYSLDFNMPSAQENRADLFSMFFGQRLVRKRIYSNAVELNVDSLPPHPHQPNAIGSFKSIHAKAQPATARQGEGIILTLEFEGDGNFERLETFALEGMPDALKWYDSKSYSEPIQKGHKKSFEYIIQGLQPGEWEIPSQKFTYFDVKNRTYKTLKSSPLLLTIVSLPTQAAANSQEKIATSIEMPKGN